MEEQPDLALVPSLQHTFTVFGDFILETTYIVDDDILYERYFGNDIEVETHDGGNWFFGGFDDGVNGNGAGAVNEGVEGGNGIGLPDMNGVEAANVVMEEAADASAAFSIATFTASTPFITANPVQFPPSLTAASAASSIATFTASTPFITANPIPFSTFHTFIESCISSLFHRYIHSFNSIHYSQPDSIPTFHTFINSCLAASSIATFTASTPFITANPISSPPFTPSLTAASLASSIMTFTVSTPFITAN